MPVPLIIETARLTLRPCGPEVGATFERRMLFRGNPFAIYRHPPV
jgi:hypothetical protein